MCSRTIGSSSAGISSAAGRVVDARMAHRPVPRLSVNAASASALAAAPINSAKWAISRVGRRGDPRAGRFDDRLLDRHQARDRPGGKDFGVATGFGQQIVGLAHLPRQSHPQRLGGVDPLRRHQQPRRVLPAHQLRQQIRRRRLGRDAQAGERHLQPRRRRHEHQVRVAENGCADADSNAVDRADQRLGKSVSASIIVEKWLPLLVNVGSVMRALHLVEVVARAKRPPVAGQQHDRHVRIRGRRHAARPRSRGRALR